MTIQQLEKQMKDYYLVAKEDCDIVETTKDKIITKEAKLKSGKFIWKEVIDSVKIVAEIDQAILDKQAEIAKLEEQKQSLTTNK